MAKTQGLVSVNPVIGTEVMGCSSNFTGSLYTLEEVNTLLTKLPEPAVVKLAAFTGLRANEIRGLQWSDYDGQNANRAKDSLAGKGN